MQKAAQHKHYLENKERFVQRRENRRNRVVRFIQAAKAGKSCPHCGESHPACLDFHHVNPEEKLASTHTMQRDMWTLDKVQAELDKCILLCANCHRKHHWELRYNV